MIPFDSMLPATELFRYYTGQLLAGRDLNDYQQQGNLLRRIHNAALHNAWGVAFGFEVAEQNSMAAINAGVGYDHYGREIVLTKTAMIDLPPDDNTVLVVRLKQVKQRSAAKSFEPAYPNACMYKPFGEPEFIWRREDEINYGLEIPLAVFHRQSNTFTKRLGIEARAEATPRTGFGTTQPGLTAWRFFKATIDGTAINLGLEVDINTTDAGFVETPCYFASLGGHRFDLKRPLFPILSLADERPDGFTFRAMLQFSLIKSSIEAIDKTASTMVSPQEANNLGLTVCWLGLEIPGEFEKEEEPDSNS